MSEQSSLESFKPEGKQMTKKDILQLEHQLEKDKKFIEIKIGESAFFKDGMLEVTCWLFKITGIVSGSLYRRSTDTVSYFMNLGDAKQLLLMLTDIVAAHENRL